MSVDSKYAGLTKAQIAAQAKKNAQAEAAAKAERDAAMMAEIEALRAENTKLQAAASAKATTEAFLRVANGGGISLYGLGRFPITLYVEQWSKVLEPSMVKKITDFAAEHQAELKKKGEDEDAYFKRTGKTKKVA